MLLIDDAHMSSIEIRDQSITRGIALIDPPLTSPSFSSEVAHTELRESRPCTWTSYRLWPIKALLTSDFTDCKCALSVQGHR